MGLFPVGDRTKRQLTSVRKRTARQWQYPLEHRCPGSVLVRCREWEHRLEEGARERVGRRALVRRKRLERERIKIRPRKRPRNPNENRLAMGGASLSYDSVHCCSAYSPISSWGILLLVSSSALRDCLTSE